LTDIRKGTFEDVWGRELVYRFPSRHLDAMFDLYSLGPNGRDEGGEGDDISCGGLATFECWRDAFVDRLVDPAWIRAHAGDLERDPVSGLLIGAPRRP
jgi:hypothetical protein